MVILIGSIKSQITPITDYDDYIPVHSYSLKSTEVSQTPYVPNGGVWYWCSRTLSCDLKIAVDINTNSGWIRKKFSKFELGKHDFKLEFEIDGGIVSMGYWSTYDMHYGGLDCWAKSPATKEAKIECNTSIAQ